MKFWSQHSISRSAPKYWIGDACGGLRLRNLGMGVTILIGMGLAIGLLFWHSWHRSH
ncbi:hypothetical protein [Nostoc sp. 'Peltigera membranacea cyanobiont' N6]|uniref:hypothetical protein n=1 Tax=Nostoc sp. 'Peltigera membranacea cyanobiont' N6 TaxID=1261031 RepID=UPI0015E487FA|nr:hypothetical protein [Nostoc sp. 'Peltigera membranacea cyanobiont' N6]